MLLQFDETRYAARWKCRFRAHNSAVECILHTDEVTGSNPVAPTGFHLGLQAALRPKPQVFKWGSTYFEKPFARLARGFLLCASYMAPRDINPDTPKDMDKTG